MPSRQQNLSRTGEWSFSLLGKLARSRHVVSEGEEITVSGSVKNDGLRLGTVYVQLLVTDSYNHRRVLFDSDKNLPGNERYSLRLVDIDIGKTRRFSCRLVIPAVSSNKHFDLQVKIWNPHFLWKRGKPYCFLASEWYGGFEVLKSGLTRPRVFVSYSWDSAEHKAWVLQLVEELRKYGIECILDQRDILGGDELPLVLEKWIMQSKAILVVCTANYTKKANGRKSGGVGFETVISAAKYMKCSPKGRANFIPITRDNDLREKLPRYLGDRMYVDMSGDNWRAEPMQGLVAAIRKRLELKGRATETHRD